MCLDPVTSTLVGCSAGACLAWQGNRLLRQGSRDSEGWPEASKDDVEDILHYSKMVQGAYTETREQLFERVPYLRSKRILRFSNQSMGPDEHSKCPPHYLYIDSDRRETCLCIRGMRLNSPADYWTLLSNHRGEGKFLDGYVHSGIFKAAEWLCLQIVEQIRTFMDIDVREQSHRLVIVGHSLGAGVASLLAMILAERCEELLNVSRDKICCFAFAPPRVLSLNLTARFADVIRGIVLQDDFWPRVSTSMVAKMIASTMCMVQFVLFSRMVKDVIISDKSRLSDVKRLYPPGALFHIVCKEISPCMQRFPFRVLTSNPSGLRFEKLVVSMRAAGDHRIRAYEEALEEAIQNLSHS